MDNSLKVKVLNYLLYAFMFFLPVSLFMSNVLLILLLIGVILFGKLEYTISNLIYTSLLVFFIYVVFIGLFSLDPEFQEYLKLLPLIVIPFVFSFFKKSTINLSFTLVLIGILVIQVIALYGVTEYYLGDGKKIALRSYSGINDILRYERPYLGFFSAIGVIIAYFIFRKSKPILFIIVCTLSFFIIILISARLALLIALLTFAIIILIELKRKIYRWLTFVLVPMAIVLALFFSSTPLEHRFIQIKNDTRLVVWTGVYNILKADYDFVFGLMNQSEIEDKLFNYYKNEADFDYQPDRERFLRKNYNTHNQYLNELLRGGVIGLLLFMLPLLYCLYNNIKEKKLFEVLLLVSILMFSFVENLLARQIGVYSVAIFLTYSRVYVNEKN